MWKAVILFFAQLSHVYILEYQHGFFEFLLTPWNMIALMPYAGTLAVVWNQPHKGFRFGVVTINVLGFIFAGWCLFLVVLFQAYWLMLFPSFILLLWIALFSLNIYALVAGFKNMDRAGKPA